jgi:hypothetical protein
MSIQVLLLSASAKQLHNVQKDNALFKIEATIHFKILIQFLGLKFFLLYE